MQALFLGCVTKHLWLRACEWSANKRQLLPVVPDWSLEPSSITAPFSELQSAQLRSSVSRCGHVWWSSSTASVGYDWKLDAFWTENLHPTHGQVGGSLWRGVLALGAAWSSPWMASNHWSVAFKSCGVVLGMTGLWQERRVLGKWRSGFVFPPQGCGW